jgi:hypothetical protein
MQNITDLRDSLLDNYEKIKSKEMELKDGKELANTAGKILNSLKIELEYNTLVGNKNKIDFLELKK